ncbi:MAG TPA: Ig-like domain-containing protein, partial [Caproicibacter sp.]|nr:Ig-like domain-containing protein [Caproicibacter sp.]
PATGISLDKNEINVERGSSAILTAKIAPDDATTTKVDWVSTDETIATVDDSGKVTGVSTGSTVITVKSRDGGFTAHCTVHVIISISSIKLNDTSLTLKKDDSHLLSATILPVDTTEDKTVHWTSSDTGVVTVDNSGNIKAVEGGTATITATVGKHTASCTVKVIVPVTGISLDRSSLTLIKGTGAALKAVLQPSDATDTSIAWTSSDNNIVSVDDAGNLKAASTGTATITATSHDGGYKTSCSVTVVIPVTGISLNQSSLSLIKGQSQTLSATISPVDATDKAVEWSTSNSGVATVDGSGKITAVGGGTAIITATTHDGGYKAICTVSVTVPVTGICLNYTNYTLYMGGNSLKLTPSIAPTDASNKTTFWASSNTNVATVDSTGNVTAVGVGTSVISVTTQVGGYSATCTITVPGIPSTPQNLAAKMSDDTNMLITWNIPVNNGGSPITGYKLTINGTDYTTTNNSYTAPCPNVSNLTISVSAANVNGYSPAAQANYSITTSTYTQDWGHEWYITKSKYTYEASSNQWLYCGGTSFNDFSNTRPSYSDYTDGNDKYEYSITDCGEDIQIHTVYHLTAK